MFDSLSGKFKNLNDSPMEPTRRGQLRMGDNVAGDVEIGIVVTRANRPLQGYICTVQRTILCCCELTANDMPHRYYASRPFSSSPPRSYFTLLRRFPDELHSGKVSLATRTSAVRALCIEILGQTPLPLVRFLDVLPAADTRGAAVSPAPAPVAPRAPPRVRRRLHTAPAPTTQTPLRREHSPSATDEGIVVEDDDYDSSSDRSVDLSLSLETLRTCTASPRSLAPVPQLLPPLPPAACDNCTKLAASALQHHTLPRATRTAAEPERLRHRYLKRWEGTGAGGADRGRAVLEAARRRTAALESRARSCSPRAHEAAVVAQYVPVRERRALFESLSRNGEALARSSEQLARPPPAVPTPRRAASLHDLQAPPSRSVSDLRQFFEAVSRGGCAASAVAGLPRHAPLPHRPFTSLTCA
ncbi:hypothetical protein EVAR_94688_1 [Eumeta japonica]|uniref:Uncharacterized protein n=1 Tax=Eumeta variegata TaxID=151549 RepID=A0A4C1UVP5_EUMVA|nr:hypothetical protein EVAR_94688_1 [Eumeta japonica]